MLSISSAAAGLGFLSLIAGAQAFFNPASSSNIAVYWGQNSANQASSQQRLSYYCQNAPDVDIIMLSFLTGINNPGMNLANAGDNCTAIAGSDLLRCPQVEDDITLCQQTYGKTIMLSMGGATYTEGGFNSPAAAVAAANNVWALFGPVQSGSTVTRPFGNAVVDGFDFDFESTVNNAVSLVSQLRSLTNAAGGKKFYLSAAPQCPYPDAADGGFIDGQVAFDWLQIQFYNNYCGVGQYPTNWNYATWDNWAKTVSANSNAKVLVGIPAAPGAANAGSYTSGTQLAAAINNAQGYSSFGGVMIWDMSQLFKNAGFLQQVVSDLGRSAAPAPTSTITSTTSQASTPTPTPTATSTTTTKASSTTSSSSAGPTPTGGLAQWSQCGGNGYTGPTQCAAPYTCVATSQWWASCQ